MFVERMINPFTLTVEAWSRALDLSGKTLVSIKKLFFRQVSVGTLGGPILIGKLAGDSMMHGISPFLESDGTDQHQPGDLQYPARYRSSTAATFSCCWSRWFADKPITMRQTEFVQQVGLSIIVLLLGRRALQRHLTRGNTGLKQFFSKE